MTNLPIKFGVVLCITAAACVFAQSDREQGLLDDGRQWLGADPGLMEDFPPLLRAAAAADLNDVAIAEPLLQSIIRGAPDSEEANFAYELLSRIYLRSGQYSRLIRNLDDWGRAFPDRPEVAQEKGDIELFRGSPDQLNGTRRLVRLQHDEGDDFSVPVSVNGEPATYLVDTGAWVSVMTASEAERLHLVLTSAGAIGDASGSGSSARTAVVNELGIGSMRFENVTFVVVPGEGPGGIIGMPILLALGRIQWSSDGGWELGGRSEATANNSRNLVFYENRLILSGEVLGKRVFVTLDTGAGDTDFNGNFATEFDEFVGRTGTKETRDITGVGGTKTFESVLLPEVHVIVDGADALLSPAHVTLQTTPGMGGTCCIGNVGRDVLTQSGRLSIDFSSMTLQLN